MPQPLSIDPLEVKLIEPDNAITRDVLNSHGLYGPHPIRFGGNKLGDMSIDGAYLYPLCIADANHAPESASPVGGH